MDTEKTRGDDRLYFCVLLALQVAFFLFLVLSHRMPKGHDAFIHFSLQYYFLNNAVNYGEIPQWVPFLTHGVSSLWWFPIQAGILQNILLFVGPVLKGLNFLPVYYLEMFIDELFLLTGTWLLAQRFYGSLASFFVALTVMDSCIWASQPWYNFHFYYALPWIIFLGHQFIDTGRWRYFLLAGNLLALQTLGNLSYTIPVTSLMGVFYFVFYIVFNFQYVKKQILAVRLDWRAVFSILVVFVSFFMAYKILMIGVDQITNYSQGRTMNSTTDIQGFLHYGFNYEFKKWLEVITGISPSEDYTLYLGILSLPLIVLGFSGFRKESRHFTGIVIFTVLLSAGSYLAVVLYHIWPMMKYYRHLSLISSFTKLFLCFMAGFGLEELISPSRQNRGLILKIVLILSVIIFFSFAFYLFYLSKHYDSATLWIHQSISSSLVRFGRYEMYEFPNHAALHPIFIRYVVSPGLLFWQFVKSGILCLFAGVVFLIFISRNRWPLLVALIVTLQAIDLMEYKVKETVLRTATLAKANSHLLDFQPMPFQSWRNKSFFEINPRGQTLWQTVPPIGTMHWSIHAFLFHDQIDDHFRTDYWLRPFDKLMRAVYGQSPDDLSVRPVALTLLSGWNYPVDNPALAKVAGIKIQFFTEAFGDSSDQLIGRILTNPHFDGDHLLISTSKDRLPSDEPVLKTDLNSLLTPGKRLRLPFQVANFSSNHLDLFVVNNSKSPIWLYYADVWNPFWKASVNGHTAEVFRANLAYKAVALDKGFNYVRFYFHSNYLTFLYTFFVFNSLVWLCIILIVTVKILEGRYPYGGKA